MERPKQWREDVAEIVSAYEAGGQDLAVRVYRAIIEARKLVRWTQLALANDFRDELKHRKG